MTLKIAFIHTEDINDKNLWSGTVYYIYHSLIKEFDDVVFFKATSKKQILLKVIFGGIAYIYKKISNKHFLNLYYAYYQPKSQSRSVDKFVERSGIDCIVSTINTPFIFTENTIPLVIITDATVKLLYEEHSNGKGWSNLLLRYLENSSLKVAQKAALIVTSSRSTADSLKNHYKIPSNKIAAIPFGANINFEDMQVHDKVIDRINNVNFLFVGRDWVRKGGDFAVAVCDELINQRVNVRLTIVGCNIPEEFHRSYITNYVFLNKNISYDFDILKKLYSETHFFMVFSKAEMYGIVFCEAAAYGLPVVTFAVGGIADIVVDGMTGIMLPKGTGPEVFASKIKTLIIDNDKYLEMSHEATKRYETLLNWDTFTNSLKNKMNEILISNLNSKVSNDIMI